MSELPAGHLFGRYEIVRRLGRGGMGTVYQATDPVHRRAVALKLLRPELAADETSQRRFYREAEALSRIQSPQVLGIYETGMSDGHLYVATQLVTGGDLRELLDREGALDADRALRLVADVATGLQAAHDAGVLHRDIKPSNVLLHAGGGPLRPVLCDLGIAQLLDVEHTRTVGLIGTPTYLAPERHRGEPATVAADVYALGCLLWASVTARPPYTGSTTEVVRGHLAGPVPQLPKTHPDAARLNPLLARLLAKDPADRPASALEVADLATRALPDAPVQPASRRPEVATPAALPVGDGDTGARPTPPPAAPRSGRAVGVVALLAGLVAAAIAIAGSLSATAFATPTVGALEGLTIEPTGRSHEVLVDFEPLDVPEEWRARVSYWWRVGNRAPEQVTPGKPHSSPVLVDGRPTEIQVWAALDGPRGDDDAGPVGTATVTSVGPIRPPSLAVKGQSRGVAYTWNAIEHSGGRKVRRVELEVRFGRRLESYQALPAAGSAYFDARSGAVDIPPNTRVKFRMRTWLESGKSSTWSSWRGTKTWKAPDFRVRRGLPQAGYTPIEFRLNRWRPYSTVACRDRTTPPSYAIRFPVDERGNADFSTGSNGAVVWTPTSRFKEHFICDQQD